MSECSRGVARGVVLKQSNIMQLRIGSDFSGLDTAYWALRLLQVSFRHVFACDCDPASLKVLEFLKPEVLFRDVRTRSLVDMPPVDLFTFGPPCQPYSRLGNREGADCEMGQLGLFSLSYILYRRPRIVLMEQVPDVVGSDFFVLVLQQLTDAGYNLHSQIAKSWEYGVPQTRQRVYLVALLNPVAQFSFPDAISPCPATSLIDVLPGDQFQVLPEIGPAGGQTRQNNVSRLLERCIEERGVNPFITPVFVNSGASAQRANYSVNMMMTVTRTEAGRQGYWCTLKGGFLEPDELARFQGFPDGFLDWRRLGIRSSDYSALLGNAMTFNVILRLLPGLLMASGYVTDAQAARMIRMADTHHPRRRWED